MALKAHPWHVSVGYLADFVHRSGDLGGGAAGGGVLASEGVECQQRYQQQLRIDGYRRERRLAGRCELEAAVLEIGGRADGCFELDGEHWVEEIKTVRGEAVEPDPVHAAQVRLYAVLLARELDLPRVGVRLTYLDADSPKRRLRVLRRDDALLERADLEAFLADTVAAMADWIAAEQRWRRQRDEALAELDFPLGRFRPGQRSLAGATWQTLRDEGRLLAQAPTGTGKTLGVLFGALKGLVEGRAERLLWLTPRGSARHAAAAALDAVAVAGGRLRSVELLGRARLCANPGAACTADSCPFAVGYYDRRRSAMRELLDDDRSGHLRITSERVDELARGHGICPVRLQRDLARWADVVIGDLAFGYDPFAQQRLLLEGEDGRAMLLVDEAHNLLERGREMFSGRLEEADLAALRAALRRAGVRWHRRLDAPLRRLRGLLEAQQGERELAREAVTPLVEGLQRLLPDVFAWQQQAPPGPLTRQVMETTDGWLRFIEAATFSSADEMLLFADAEGRTLHARCLDPSRRLAPTHALAAATVGFSATLTPLAMQAAALGLGEEARLLDIPSPFPPEHQCTLLVDDLPMCAREREGSLPGLTRLIVGLVAAMPGHHLVFAPSFAFLDRLATRLGEALPAQVELLRQRPDMDEGERGAFLGALQHPDDRSRVALAVTGGLFAEGIDLRGEALVAVTVAGLPLPPPDLVRQRLRDYHGDAGFEMAFRIPAITRTLQAAGRLIRSETDRGVLCLVDARLRQRDWRQLLPRHWQWQRCAHAEAPGLAERFRAAAPPAVAAR